MDGYTKESDVLVKIDKFLRNSDIDENKINLFSNSLRFIFSQPLFLTLPIASFAMEGLRKILLTLSRLFHMVLSIYQLELTRQR